MKKIMLSLTQLRSDHSVLASHLNFGNTYCKYPIQRPKPLDNTAPQLFKSFDLKILMKLL